MVCEWAKYRSNNEALCNVIACVGWRGHATAACCRLANRVLNSYRLGNIAISITEMATLRLSFIGPRDHMMSCMCHMCTARQAQTQFTATFI